MRHAYVSGAYSPCQSLDVARRNDHLASAGACQLSAPAQAGRRFDAEFGDVDDTVYEEIDALTGAARADGRGQTGSADGERVCKAVPPPR